MTIRAAENVPGHEVRLSPRETQLLGLVAEGRPNKDIAFLMGVTLGTLGQMMYYLFRNLEVSSRAEAIIWAMQHPSAFQRYWVNRRLHLPGCQCPAVYCSAMRIALAACEEEF
jgi:DNA-binding CsgD family transcriptional regulator